MPKRSKIKNMRLRHPLLFVMVFLTVAATLVAANPVRARNAMVVAQEPLAADVGVEVLKAGGNAIDAAVAVGFALAVTHPSAGNIGGGGFLLARFADGSVTFVDFREQAPARASRNMYLDDEGNLTTDSRSGWLAAGVPGTVKGLEYAHHKYGKKPWAELITPAVELARDGFPVSWALARSLKNSERLAQFDESRRVFLRGGKYFEAGDTLVQPELANTLARIRTEGSRDFYEGETAKLLVAEMGSAGGLFTAADLKAYQVHERQPLKGEYRGHTIFTAPPPSSGGVGILQMFAMLSGSGYTASGAGSAASIHYVAEVMRRYYADRSEYLADPGYYEVPVKRLLDESYIGSRRDSIDPLSVTRSTELGAGEGLDTESSDTTHFSIIDSQGNAVALTYTINGSYGCGVTVPGLGFLLNNEMDDFSAKPGVANMFGLVQGEANRIQPGKRPLSSMTPTIVVRGDEPYLVLGAPGGARIINGVLQVILNVIDFRMDIQDAVDQPRFHHQWKPDKLSVESGISPDTIRLLRERGHEVESIGSVALVEAILSDGDWLHGATDRRAHGKAAGY
jgi:gamma-glutamyltranspeptidase / glutathione hydrolase